MERWAANTLRTLGIILTGGFVVVTSLFLALLSVCAAQGGFEGTRHPDQAAMYAICATVVVVAGVAFISWLARGIYRSSRVTAEGVVVRDAVAGSEPTVALHLSPQGRKAIDRVVYALTAQIVLSAAVWLFNQIRYWSRPHIFAPFPSQKWALALLIPFLLYHIPYAMLIYALVKRPDRRAFAYSIAVPAVLVMQALFSVGYAGLFLQGHLPGLLLLFVPWAMHIVILVLAYQAIQQVGLHPEPVSLIIAAAVALVYFLLLHGATPLLYRFAWR